MKNLVCLSCENEFPSRMIIDGKMRNLYGRKQCLTCSPWGEHQTRVQLYRYKVPGKCECGTVLKSSRRRFCNSCNVEKGRTKQEDKVKAMVGLTCSVCGYGDELRWRSMDFHHVNPETKSFCINKNSMNKSWATIETELRKCILVCCRCHREIESGLIPTEEVEKIHSKVWKSTVNW